MNRKALAAEFIGTFTLIFIGVSSIAANQMSGGALGLTGIALAHGLAIAVMVSATAAISGGHLNPAVSLAALAGGKMDKVDCVAYIVAQCFGGVMAAFFLGVVWPSDILISVKMGTPALGSGITPVQGLAMEMVLTFFLVFVVFGTAIDSRAPKMGGLFIGLTVALDILAGGPLTGAAMNPARHFGPAVMGGYALNSWIYWVGPLLGGVLAALVYRNAVE